MHRLRSLVVYLLCAVPAALDAAWQTDAPGGAVTYVSNDTGQRLELAVADGRHVTMNLYLNSGFETFSPSNCPTFQIDDREPMHHFEPGERCVITDKRVTFHLGDIDNRHIESLIMHRLINGNRVAFRYTVDNGQYRRTEFTLSRSKQALRRALGFNLRVDVD